MISQVMNIGIDGVLRNAVSLENPAVSLDDPASWDNAGLLGEKTSAGVHVTEKVAMGYSPMWRAINLITGDVGRMPFHVYKRRSDGGKDRDLKHPAYRLCRRKANPFMRAKAFWQTITYHALIRGNGFAAIVRDGALRPGELLLLDTEDTYPVKLIDDRTKEASLWYLTFVEGEPVRLPARDVLHIKGLADDGLCGVDVLTLMAEALGVAIATRRWVSSFFANGTNITGVLMVPEGYKKEKAENLQRSFNKSSSGLSNAGKTALLKDGAKWVPISTKPEEAAATGILDHEIRTAANITGVPSYKLGDSSQTSYNSLELRSQDYLDDALEPWLAEIESEANEKLLTEKEQDKETHYCEFLRASRLRTDTAARWNSYEQGRGLGIYSVNDVNVMESRPKIGPEGDKRHIPANWIELGATPPANGNQAKARNALRRLTLDVLKRKNDIERERVNKAASKEGFSAWSETFYADHARRLWDELRPVCQSVEALTGKPLASRWKRAIRNHVTARRTALSAATNVSETVSSWSPADLCDVLLPRAGRKGLAPCS